MGEVNAAAIEQQASALTVRAESLAIETHEQYEVGAEMIRGLRALADEVRDTFREAKQKAQAAHKAVVQAERRHLQPIDRAQTIVREKMGVFHREQERARRRLEAEAAERAREAEESLRLAEAEALEAAGAPDAAAAALDTPMPVPIETPPPVKTQGVSARTLYSAEVTDLPALVAAVAEGKAPVHLLQLDSKAANEWARATKGSFPVPGLVIRERSSVAVGR